MGIESKKDESGSDSSERHTIDIGLFPRSSWFSGFLSGWCCHSPDPCPPAAHSSTGSTRGIEPQSPGRSTRLVGRILTPIAPAQNGPPEASRTTFRVGSRQRNVSFTLLTTHRQNRDQNNQNMGNVLGNPGSQHRRRRLPQLYKLNLFLGEQ